MKHLLLAALSCSALLTTQPTPKQSPFAGVNTIVLTTPEAAPANLVKLAEVARAQGYTVDSLTDTRLVTAPKTYEFKQYGIITPALHRFVATAAGSSILLTGTIRTKLNNQQQFEARMGWYNAKDISQNKACFTQAQKLALAYTGAQVGYTKQP